jgi:predicted ribosomally synthesized peptide with nif11-like leader
MKGSSEFLHQVQNDPAFIERAQMCATEEERAAFLRQEGFEFTGEELEAAMRSLAFISTEKPAPPTKDNRKVKRYNVFMKITEINGQPMGEAAILDICAWGARIESLIQFSPDSPVEISFPLPCEGKKKKKLQLSGKVVWSGQVPFSKRYQTGLQFYESLDQPHLEKDLCIEGVKSAIQQQHEEISNKEFLNIKEFAQKVGVHWFTVWRWTVEHRIKFKQVKSGCKILIPASELSQFKASSE